MAVRTVRKCDRCRREALRLHRVSVPRRLDYKGNVTTEPDLYADPIEGLCGSCTKPLKAWLERRS